MEEETKKPEETRHKHQRKEKRPLFEEVEGGYYDEMNFYILPNNGGFYDPKGVYFNSDGYNEEGGYYDDEGRYFPPKRDAGRRKPRNDVEDDDELIRQFEGALAEDEDVDDEIQNRYYQQFKKEVIQQEAEVHHESEEEEEDYDQEEEQVVFERKQQSSQPPAAFVSQYTGPPTGFKDPSTVQEFIPNFKKAASTHPQTEVYFPPPNEPVVVKQVANQIAALHG